MIAEQTITKKTQHLGSTEYTVNINFSLPEGYEFDKTGHFNKLYISFGGDDQGPDKQNQIIREHPSFPLGVPVRGLGRHVDLFIDYKFRYYHKNNPDDVKQRSYRFVIPVDFDGDHKNDSIELDEKLSVD